LTENPEREVAVYPYLSADTADPAVVTSFHLDYAMYVLYGSLLAGVVAAMWVMKVEIGHKQRRESPE
jgi:hypothetical protein